MIGKVTDEQLGAMGRAVLIAEIRIERVTRAMMAAGSKLQRSAEELDLVRGELQCLRTPDGKPKCRWRRVNNSYKISCCTVRIVRQDGFVIERGDSVNYIFCPMCGREIVKVSKG